MRLIKNETFIYSYFTKQCWQKFKLPTNIVAPESYGRRYWILWSWNEKTQTACLVFVGLGCLTNKINNLNICKLAQSVSMYSNLICEFWQAPYIDRLRSLFELGCFYYTIKVSRHEMRSPKYVKWIKERILYYKRSIGLGSGEECWYTEAVRIHV